MLELPDAAKQYRESFDAWSTLAQEAAGDPLVAESVQDNVDTLLIIMEALEPQAAEEFAEVVVHQPEDDAATQLRRERINSLRETEPFKKGTITEERVQEMLSSLPEPAKRYADEDKLFATSYFVSRVLSNSTVLLDTFLLVAEAANKEPEATDGLLDDDSVTEGLAAGEGVQKEVEGREPEPASEPTPEDGDDGLETDVVPVPSSGEDDVTVLREEIDASVEFESDGAGAENIDDLADKERMLKVDHMMAKYIQARSGLLEHLGLPALECDEYVDITKVATLPNPLDHHGEFESLFAEVGLRIEMFIADPSGFANQWFEAYEEEDPGWGLLGYLIKTVTDDETGAAFRKAMTAEVVSAYEEPKGKPKDRQVTRVVFDVDGEEVTIESNGHAAVEHSLRRYLAQYDAGSRELLWTADEQSIREKTTKLHSDEERHQIEQTVTGPMSSALRRITGVDGAITKTDVRIPVSAASSLLLRPDLIGLLRPHLSKKITLTDSTEVDLATILTTVVVQDCQGELDMNLNHRKHRRVVQEVARRLIADEVRAYERRLAVTGVTTVDAKS